MLKSKFERQPTPLEVGCRVFKKSGMDFYSNGKSYKYGTVKALQSGVDGV